MRTSIAAAVVGALVLVVGLMLHADRAAASFVAFYVATASAVLGVLLMIMIAHLSGAVWFVPFRQAAATVTATLPWLALLAIPLVLALPAHGLSFTLRALVYWAAWLVVGELLRNSRTSRQRAPRRSGGLLHEQRTARLTVLSAAGIPAATLALTFAAFDWMMSLSPGWSSTVYGPYVCTGGMMAALAVLAVAGATSRDDPITAGREHYQSL